LLAARGFIPYLPVSSGAGADLLPHISRIAWGELALVYALFGVTCWPGRPGWCSRCAG
jgi:hypothetical protein